MEFYVEMWNDELEKEVLAFIKKVKNDTSISTSQISILPFNEISWKKNSLYRPNFRLAHAETWHPYRGERSVPFTIVCSNLKECNELSEEMRKNPALFARNFYIRFHVNSERIRTRKADLPIILAGTLMYDVKKQLPNAEYALLTPVDEQILIDGIADITIMNTLYDVGEKILSKNARYLLEVFIRKNLLATSSRIIINGQSNEMWNFVFWHSEICIRDKLTKSLNMVYNKLDIAHQNKIKDQLLNDNEFDIEELFDVSTVKKVYDTKIRRKIDTSDESIAFFLHDCKNRSQWNGKKFIPKPMSLSKINLTWAQKIYLGDKKLNIEYSTAPFRVKPVTVVEEDLKRTNDLMELQQKLIGWLLFPTIIKYINLLNG